VAGVGDLVQRTRDDQTQVGYLVAERLGGRVESCTFCTVHIEMKSKDFLVDAQNQGRRFSGLDLKTDSSGLIICVSKST
jgi:hypothetical protein